MSHLRHLLFTRPARREKKRSTGRKHAKDHGWASLDGDILPGWMRRAAWIPLSRLVNPPPTDLVMLRNSNGFDYPEYEQVAQYYPQYYHKSDKDGRPVYIEQLGKLDIPKLYALTTQERQLKRLVSEYEKFLRDRCPACSKEVGHLVETSCTILDLYNAGISSFYKGRFLFSVSDAFCAHAKDLC